MLLDLTTAIGAAFRDRYARKHAPGQRSLFGGEKLASDKTQGKFRWVTIGGEPGEKGDHEGGTPIKIEKETGKIVAGPHALAEKGIKKVSDFGKSESERKQAAAKHDGDSDGRAAKAGPGVDAERQPAGAVGADESAERTPPAKTHDPYSAALSEVKAAVEVADMSTAAGELEVMKAVVDIGKKHGVSANELWREATWSANHRDIEAEVSGEADERAAERPLHSNMKAVQAIGDRAEKQKQQRDEATKKLPQEQVDAIKEGRIKMVQAPAGGAVSDVNGKFYKGGHWMPVHGLSAGQPKPEAKAKPQDKGTPPIANPNGKAPTAREMSPDQVATEKERRETQERWNKLNAGPLAKAGKWLGDAPNHKAITDDRIGLKEWQSWASEAGPDGIKRLIADIEPQVHAHIDAEGKTHRDEWEKTGGNGFGRAPQTDDDQWVKDQLKRQADDALKSQPRINGKHEKEVPGSHYARELVSQMMQQHKSIEGLEKVSDAMARASQPTAAANQQDASDSFDKAFTEGRVDDVVDHLRKMPLADAIKTAGDFGLPVHREKTKKSLLELVRRIAENNTPEKREARAKQEATHAANMDAKAVLENARANRRGLIGAPLEGGEHLTDEQMKNPHDAKNREAVQRAWSSHLATKLAKLNKDDPFAQSIIEAAKREGFMQDAGVGTPAGSGQAGAITPTSRESDYFKGDRVEFTGKMTPEGFREFEFMEGHRKGQLGVMPTNAQKDAAAAKRQSEWADQQQQFKRLHEPETPSRESVVKDIAEKVAEKLGVDARPSEAAYDRARHATAATKDAPDTAQVNVPLAKRGDIDKQIDQLKENDRRDAKERARESAKIRNEAKALFETHGDALALSTIQKNGGTLKEAKAAMKDIIASNPALAKKMLEDFAEKSSREEPKPEDPQESSPAVPKGLEGLPPHGIERLRAMHERIDAGTATADDVRAFHADMQSPEFQSAIRADLNKMTVPELKRRGAQGWYGREKKADLVEQLSGEWLDGGSLAGLDGKGLSYVVGGDMKAAKAKAIAKKLESLTDEHIKEHAAGIANKRKEREERIAQAKAGMENPTTLEDFERLKRQADGDESKMKPEHLEAFDDLRARSRRATAEARKAAVTVSHEATKTVGGFDLSKNFHSKRGHDIFTASPQNRVERDEYNSMNAAAKKLGGWYYKAFGGTPGGFHFPTESARDEFLKAMGGGKGNASETQAARTEQKQQTAAESLREKADAIHASASEELGRDRQTNTARRADMAASIEARARGQQAKAETMKRLADRLEKGELQHLAGVRAGTHLDTLDSMMREARYKSLNANRDKMGGRRYEDALSEPASRDDIAHAEFPYPKLYHSDLLKYSSELADVPGLKNIAASLRKKVDEGFRKEGNGGLKFSGGQFVTPDQTRLNGIPEGKAVRVHRSKDRRLAGELQKHGLDHAYTADLGKTFAKTPDEAIAAAGMRGHALDLVDAKKATNEQVAFTDPADIAKLQTIASRLKNSSDRGKQLIADNLNWKMEHIKRLHAMDITNAPELRAALREYHSLKAEKQSEDPIKAAERKLVGRRIDGFFPTPKTLANRVIEEADIRPGMKVLEPSAGKGDLLDAIKSRHGDEVTSHAIEPVHDLREVLGAKGHELVGHDFLSHKEGGYDRIVMNPPFENHQDIEHVKHAYSLLAPGGKVVAIMSNGGGSKRQAFDDWLSEQGGSSEDLPEGSFSSNEAFRKTGVNTRLVTIEKPGSESQKPDQHSRRDLQDMVRYAIGNAVKERYSEACGPMSQDMLRNYGKSLRDRIASAAAQTDRNPTDEQKKAGNYRKGKFWLWGHEVAIENPKGSTRSGTDSSGKAWSVTMGAHYGYVRRTLSKADGDAVDCFIGPHPESEVVFVVNQCKPSGKFDEHKCVLGCRSIGEAKKLYLSCYSAGWQGMQSIVPMTKPQFLTWLERGDTTRAVKFNESIERYSAQWNEEEHPRKNNGQFMNRYYRIQPKGLGVTHRSQTSNGESRGLHVVQTPEHLFGLEGKPRDYGGDAPEVVEIESPWHRENGDVEGVEVDPMFSRITRRWSPDEFALQVHPWLKEHDLDDDNPYSEHSLFMIARNVGHHYELEPHEREPRHNPIPFDVRHGGHNADRYDKSSDLAAKLERMGLKPTPGMVLAFEKAYERRKLKDMGLPIPQHLSQGRPFEEVLAETPAHKAHMAKEAAKQAKKAPQPKPQEPVVSVPTKPKRQPGDGTPGWQRVGGAPVFVDGNGKITKGCPGLKGEHVSDLIDESDESRKRREVRNDHALAMGKDGKDFTPSQLKKLETGRNRERHEAAEKAAKKAGVPTHKVLSQMPEIEKTARSMGVKRTDAADALGDALRAIGDQYEIERMNAKEVAKAHKLAMRLTGLTPAKIHKLEDSGKDHTAVRGFDVNAYTFAAENESPFVHFDKHSGDIEQQVWDFIKNGKPEKPTLSKVASNAADMLANSIKQRLRKAGVAVAPAEDHYDEWAAMERREQPANEDRFIGDEEEIPEHHKHASPDDEPFDKFSRRVFAIRSAT